MLWGYLIGYGYLAVLLGTAEFVGRRTKISTEVTRKVLHCLIGLEWLVLYFFFADTWQIVVIPATFILVNALSYRFKVFKSIEREQDNHLGTIFYAVAMTAMSIACCFDRNYLVPFGVATFCLSFGDAAAALAGKYLKPNYPVFGKTVNGTVFCYIFAFLAQILLFAILRIPFAWRMFALLAGVCALSELLSRKGLDNLLICAWCCAFAYAAYYANDLLPAMLMCFGGFVLAGVTYNAKLFSLPASVLSGIMLATLGLWGGWFAYFAVLGCFALTALVEKTCRCRHATPRTAIQVLQNGLVAWAMVFAYRFVSLPALLYAFAVGMSQSMCDSVASALGSKSRRNPVDIITHRRVEKGLSGAISLEGTLGALAVAVLPALAAYFVQKWHIAQIIVFVFPFLGMLLDSVLGATLQRKNRCVVCGALCETTAHCSRPTQHAKGLAWLGNGSVNMICNILTTLSAFAVLYFIS